MSNPFSFEEQPCLDFLHSDTPQSNSLLANIMVKEEDNQQHNFSFHLMQGQRYNSHFESMHKMEHDDRSTKPKTKQKKKVFYRDKMAELMNQQNYIKPEYNYVDLSQFEKGKSPLSRDQQLKRNRQSAKQSRQRKKQYVETLQQKNRNNLKQISELIQRLRETQMERDRLKQSNNAHVNSYNQLKNQAYEKLSQFIQNSQQKSKQKNNEEIEECINQLKEKFGSAGKERIALVNYYMSEIIENLITDFQKYFINCALVNTGIFLDTNDSRHDLNIGKMDLQVANILGLEEARKKNALVNKFKDRFKKEATLFNNICQQLYYSFNNLISQSSILENIFSDMRKQFEPQMIAKMILYFEQNKYRKDLRRMRNEWYENFSRSEQQQVTDSIRKLTKRHQYP